MRILIKQRSDLFFPLCISQCPSLQHSVRMNDVRPPRSAMPLMRGNGAIFPQTVGRQNVELSRDQSSYQLTGITHARNCGSNVRTEAGCQSSISKALFGSLMPNTLEFTSSDMTALASPRTL